MVCIMEMLKESPANQTKLARFDASLSSMLDEVLQRGFHGLATIELSIADGTSKSQLHKARLRLRRALAAPGSRGNGPS